MLNRFLSIVFAGLFLFLLLPRTLTGQTAEQNQTDVLDTEELAQSILEDRRMDRVKQMGHHVFRSGLSAGSGYSEVWIRDLNTFIVPALEVASPEKIRQALMIFLYFQGDNGNIVDGYVSEERALQGYKLFKTPEYPELRAHKNTVETDQESSLVQAVCKYVRVTGDRDLLETEVRGESVRERLDRALRYPLESRYSKEYELIWGATTADWGDVQPEHVWGVEFDESSHRAIDIYDNAMLIIAMDQLLDVALSDDDPRFRFWSKRRDALRESVRQHLWKEKDQKFIPHLYLEGSPFPGDYPEEKIYFHGGTAVAIEAGLLTRPEIFVSYGQMLANRRLAGAATIGLTLYPAYPKGFFKNPVMAPYSYQNGGDWTWFGARLVRQLAQHGMAEEAYRELVPMLERVLENHGFYEWWTIENQPRGSGTYRGSAGVLLEAIAELQHWAQSNQ